MGNREVYRMNVDQRLLDACEKLGHWTQVKYDRDAFWIAHKLTHIANIAMSVLYALLLPQYSLSFAILTIVCVLFLFLFFEHARRLFQIPLITNAQKKAYAAIQSGCRNPLEARIVWRSNHARRVLYFSLGNILFALLLPEVIIWLLYPLSDLVVYYLISTTPLHPNEVEKRQTYAAGAVPLRA